MKTIAQLIQGLMGMVDGDPDHGSRKLELGVASIAICAAAGSWVGVAISAAGTAIAFGIEDAAKARAG